MSDSVELAVVLTASDLASRVIEDFAGKIEGLGPLGVAAGVGLAAVAAGAVAIGAAVGDASNFDAMLTKIQNNTGMTDQEVGTLHDTILQLGQDTGASFSSIADGFMHVKNLTGDAATAQDILRVATESAMSTGGDAAATANVLAQAMHEYGLDTSDATDATQRHADITANATTMMGQMHLAAQDSNMSLEQFSDNSGRAIGVAANLKVPLDQVDAAYVGLTKHGFDAAGAQVQIVDALTHMIKPTSASEAELKKLSQTTGVDLVSDFTAGGVASKGLSGILADLQTAYQRAGLSQEDATAETMKLINAQRGGLGMATLLGTGYADFTNELQRQNDQMLLNSVTDDAMARTHATLQNSLERLGNSFQAIAITLGERLLPVITPLVGQLADNLPAALDAAGTAAGIVLTGMQALASGLKADALTALNGLEGALDNAGAALSAWAAQAGPAGQLVGDALSAVHSSVQALELLLEGNFSGAAAVAQQALDQFGGAGQDVVNTAAQIRDLITENSGVMSLLAGAAAGAAAAWVVMTTATVAQTVATTAATAAQAALDLALDANPIGLFVVALAAATAALVTLYLTNDTFREHVDAARDAVQIAAQLIGEAFSFIGSKVQEALQTAVVIITAFQANAGEAAALIGQAIVQGIGNALQAGMSWVAQQAANLAQAAINAAKAALGIASPSKEFMLMGENIGDGLNLGILASVPKVKAAVDTMGDSILSEMQTYVVGVGNELSSVGDKLDQIAQDTGDKVNQAIIQTADGIAQAQQQATDAIASMLDNEAFSATIQSQKDALSQAQARGKTQMDASIAAADTAFQHQQSIHQLDRTLSEALAKAKTQAEKDAAQQAYQDGLQRLKDQEADQAAMADHQKQMAAQVAAFQASQAKETANLNVQIQQEQNARQEQLYNTDRDKRIQALNDALTKKEAQIQTDADKERQTLLVSLQQRVQDLYDQLVSKIPTLTGAAQTALDGFLARVEGDIEGMTARVIAAANNAAQAVNSIPSAPASRSADTVSSSVRDANGLPHFDAGGVVPGPIGAPLLAVVHGGEAFGGTNGQRGDLVGGGGFSISALAATLVSALRGTSIQIDGLQVARAVAPQQQYVVSLPTTV